jgi:hypothetical protein
MTEFAYRQLADAIRANGHITGAPAEAEEKEHQPPAGAEKLDDFERRFAKRQRKASNRSIEDEVKEYRELLVEDGADCLAWWSAHASRFPNIARLARMFLAASASSAPAERVFSKLNIVVQKRTARLKPERAGRRVFTRNNLPIYDPVQ